MLVTVDHAHTVAYGRIKGGGVDVIGCAPLSSVRFTLGGTLALYGHDIRKLDATEGDVALAYSLTDYEKGCFHTLGENVVIKGDGHVFCIHQYACTDKGEGGESDYAAIALNCDRCTCGNSAQSEKDPHYLIGIFILRFGMGGKILYHCGFSLLESSYSESSECSRLFS